LTLPYAKGAYVPGKEKHGGLGNGVPPVTLTNEIPCCIVYPMEVTAIIADELINEVKLYTRSATATEAITIALKDWINSYNIKELNKKISQRPVVINDAQKIRETNRLI
jgi:hypothetical protein